MRIAMAAVLVCGCTGPTTDSGERDDTGALEPTGTAVVATVADDYATGALATITVDDRRISDTLAPLSGDPQVVVEEGLVYVLNRLGTDSVRIYQPGQWAAPDQEFSVGERANPQDVDVCAGRLHVSLYGRDHLAVYPPEGGALVDTVDLSAFDDGDGLPEVAGLVQRDDKLYAALQRFDRDSWVSTGGVVVEVDCATGEVGRSWEVGPSPDVYAHPGEDDLLVVRTGGYWSLDGELAVLDLATGELGEAVLTEVDLGEDLVAFAGSGGVGLVLTAAFGEDDSNGVACVDLDTWALTPAQRTGSSLFAVAVDPRGQAWIAARTSWVDPDTGGGLLVYDMETCTELTGGDWIQTTLQPFNLAFY